MSYTKLLFVSIILTSALCFSPLNNTPTSEEQEALEFAVIPTHESKEGFIEAQWKFVLKKEIYDSGRQQEIYDGRNQLNWKVIQALNLNGNGNVILKIEGGALDGIQYNNTWRMHEERSLGDKLVMRMNFMEITIGTPGVDFHRVMNWIIVRGLQKLNYKVTIKDQEHHKYMYPQFTGSNGQEATIDVVISSDLPFNHIPYMGPEKYDPEVNPPWTAPKNWKPKDWKIVGTVNEGTNIIVAAPAGAGLKKVSDLKSVDENFSREILTVAAADCPACEKNGVTLAKALGDDWKIVPLREDDFTKAVQKKTKNGEIKFATIQYIPNRTIGRLPELTELAVADPWPRSTVNQGKIVARRDRLGKLTPEAQDFLHAAFIGNKNVAEMDEWAQTIGPEKAADKWISENIDHFMMYLGVFNFDDEAKAREN